MEKLFIALGVIGTVLVAGSFVVAINKPKANLRALAHTLLIGAIMVLSFAIYEFDKPPRFTYSFAVLLVCGLVSIPCLFGFLKIKQDRELEETRQIKKD